MASRPRTPGPAYLRTSRPKTRGDLQPADEVLAADRSADRTAQRRATVIAAGITCSKPSKPPTCSLAEGVAIRVIDAYSVQPDSATLDCGWPRDRRSIDYGRGSLRGGRTRRRGERSAGARQGFPVQTARGPRDSSQWYARGAARSFRHLRAPSSRPPNARLLSRRRGRNGDCPLLLRRPVQRIEQQRQRRMRLRPMLRSNPEQHHLPRIHLDRHHRRPAVHQVLPAQPSRRVPTYRIPRHHRPSATRTLPSVERTAS